MNKSIILFLFVAFISIGDSFGQLKSLDKFRKNVYKNVKKVKKQQKKFKKDQKNINKLTGSDKKKKSDKDSLYQFSGREEVHVAKYQQMYTFLNGSDEVYFDDVDPEWDSVYFDKKDNGYYKLIKDSRKLDDDKRVFSWYPYWMDSAYKQYNYQFVNDLIFFSYDIDPKSGSYIDKEVINDFVNGSIVDFVQAQGAKAHIAVTAYNKDQVENFLNDNYAQAVFVDSIKSIFTQTNLDGIVFDFIIYEPSQREKFNKFLLMTEASLSHMKEEEVEIILSLPIQKECSDNYDVSALDHYVDYYIVVNNRDHNLLDSSPITPLMPLKNDLYSHYSIEEALYRYAGRGVSPKKIAFNLYDFISIWKVKDNEMMLGYHEQDMPFEFLNTSIPNYTSKLEYDSVFASNFIRKDQFVYWFETDNSLDHKMDWLGHNNVSGVGVWSLKDDKYHKKFWDNISKHMASDSIVQIYPIEHKKSFAFNIAEKLYERKEVVLAVLIIQFIGLILGLVMSVLDWRVREYIFQRNLVIYIYVFFVLLTILGALFLFGGIGEGILSVFLGFLISIAVFVILSRLIHLSREKTP
ncbi:glycoside hydrolase family 18 protein [Aureibacter tunicatorum]|uniref:Chitinase II/V-like catalytic domain-containing protein n=1 Tax=Aureibacter tunicatorum TaxID=866807 RepID=A0AAE3XR71_9BACT|nr:glycoside hydrolase family 18 protein [Aureibacter tunicatorum]MDR6241652.1 hypothetical protein [Aureibacter tunicatorum]BDD07362.1 hypothetical protein AUTU_48450 [Aureibacter tunicatorum]